MGKWERCLMCSAILVSTGPLVVGARPSGAAPVEEGLAPAAQVRFLPRPNVTMSATATLDGGVLIEGSGDDLTFRKNVRLDGTSTVEISSRDDHVVIDTADGAVAVTRNNKRLTFAPVGGRDEQLGAVARLLADSRALRRFRLAGASVLDSEETSPSAVAVLLSDALVGMLTGDHGAPSRVARHLTRGIRSRLRNVSEDDCYYSWERRVLRAMNELEACIEEGGAWSTTVRLACSTRWYLMVESYWVSFLTCSGWKF